ncbi:MAG: hypothetical protein H6737_14645 [Alphaproteobacteria bacterium]|nr:hypothetical protein [Alphaproteobacteria bacterium]
MILRSPASLAHPVLSPRAVMVVKLLALAWAVTGQITVYPQVRVPPLALLAAFEGSPAWPVALTFLGVLGVLGVWLTGLVRTGAMVLAASIGLGMAGDLAWFSNNRAFTAVVLALLGLAQTPAQERWVPWQCGVVFLGAAFDKTLSPDWRSGRFLATFVDGLADYGLLWSPGGYTGGRHCLAELAAAWGTPWLFAAASWLVILGEWAIGVGFLLRHRAVVTANAAFFVGLVLLTGSPMGMFAFAGTIVSLLLIDGLGEGRRLGDHVGYWAAVVVLLGSPLFSQALVVLVAVAVAATYDRAFRT